MLKHATKLREGADNIVVEIMALSFLFLFTVMVPLVHVQSPFQNECFVANFTWEDSRRLMFMFDVNFKFTVFRKCVVTQFTFDHEGMLIH